MSVCFVLAPQAALDLVEIWRYIKEQTSLTRNHCKSLPFFTDTVMWNGSPRAAYERWLPCSRQESSGRLAGAQADYSGLISVERVLRAIGWATQVETSAILPACYLSNLHSRAIGPLM